VAQVAHFATAEWDAVLERSARWRLGSVVRHALEYASSHLDVALPPEASPVMAGRSPRKERRALRAYVTDRRYRGGQAISTLGAIRGIRGKAAYIRALLFPDRDFLSDRQGEGRPSYMARWRVALGWLRSRSGRGFFRLRSRRRA